MIVRVKRRPGEPLRIPTLGINNWGVTVAPAPATASPAAAAAAAPTSAAELAAQIKADPTIGQPGGSPITYPAYPCQIRYTADGLPQTNGTRATFGTASEHTCKINQSGAWTDFDLTQPFDGLQKWVDGIGMYYKATGSGGIGVDPLGWNLTADGKAEYARRVAVAGAQSPIYAPLPPGIDGTIKKINPSTITDPVTMEYAIALDAATANGPDKKWVYYDPYDWSGHTVLPDGFLAPADGGVATFASEDVLDTIQKQKGVAGNEWYWILYTHPDSGQIKAFLTQHIWQGGDIFSKLGSTGLLAIQILGAILGAVTLGLSTVAAGLFTAAAKVDQTQVAADNAKQQASHDAAVLQSQADYQAAQTTQQVDQFYQQNQDTFLAAGYDQAAWDSLTLQQKTDLIQAAANGQLQPTPAAIEAANQVQQTIDTAVQGAVATAGTGVTSSQPSGFGGLALLIGAGLAVWFGTRR
jgi:hypothetical protein